MDSTKDWPRASVGSVMRACQDFSFAMSGILTVNWKLGTMGAPQAGPLNGEVEDHFVVRARLGDVEFFGSDFPAVFFVKGCRGFAGVGPDEDHGFFSGDSVNVCEQFASETKALMGWIDGHSAKLAGG